MRNFLIWGAAILLGLLIGRLAADVTYREGRELKKSNSSLYKRTSSEEEKLSSLKRSINIEKRNLTPEALQKARKAQEESPEKEPTN
jgi:multidrug efflux pump subunit AcrA (membrane-fusion protein)